MKKSARAWVVALVMSLVPLGYVMAREFSLPVVWNDYYGYASLAFGFICSFPIWSAAVLHAKTNNNRQDVLSLMALSLSYGYAFISSNLEYYWQPTSLTAILLASGLVLNQQLAFVEGQKRDLSSLLPAKATLVDGRELEHIAANELEISQVILVRPGTVIPADGYVIQGQSLVTQELVTGEPEPLLKVPGDWVIAGSENLPGRSADNSPLTIRVSEVAEELLIHEMGRAVANGIAAKGRFEKYSKVTANILTPLAISAASVAAGSVYLLSESLELSFSAAVGILLSAQINVISQSVGLAVKASAIKASALGVLVRAQKSFEALSSVNHVVLNKTGVLTKGYRSVGKIHLARNTSIGSEGELLALAAAVEVGTSHELGHLIIQEAAKRGLEIPQVSDFAPIPGLGVSAQYDGSLVQVGNAGMVNVTGVNINPYDFFQISNAYSAGSSVVFISIDALLVGYIEFPDSVRAGSMGMMIALSGKKAITVLSGDATALVEKVTNSLGITDFAAEVLSTRKADWIKELRANGSKVLLVADGHYDAAALAEADVAIAFGAGHDIHLGSADLIQVSQNPIVVPRLLQLSTRSQSYSLWNVVVATALAVSLSALAVLGTYASIIAFSGLAASWVLLGRIARLAK